MRSDNAQTQSYTAQRLMALAVIGVGALLHTQLHGYVTGFLNGAYTTSVLSGTTIIALQELFLVKVGFAAYALIISGGIQFLFPASSLSDGFIDDLIDETLLGGLLVVGLLAPLYEELKYRVFPFLIISAIFYLFGNVGFWHWLAVAIAVLDTTEWVTAHGLRTPIIAPLGMFYGFMLWNGLLIEAFIVHATYNSMLVVLQKVLP